MRGSTNPARHFLANTAAHVAALMAGVTATLHKADGADNRGWSNLIGHDAARAVRDSNTRKRAAALLAVTNGEMTVAQYLVRACQADGDPLLSTTLKQLLMAQPGWSPAQAKRTIARMLELTRLKEVPSERALTLRWLLNKSTGGTRLIALAEAVERSDRPAWPGFPYAPRPKNR